MKPEDLLKLVSTPMPFGKHKGVLIADLPGNYLNWFAREGFPQGEVGRLLQLMQEIDHNGLSDLLKLVNTPMPFGKHKGVLIADLPGNYLNWFAREGFPKGEVGQLLRLMQEIDHNGLKDLLRPLRR